MVCRRTIRSIGLANAETSALAAKRPDLTFWTLGGNGGSAFGITTPSRATPEWMLVPLTDQPAKPPDSNPGLTSRLSGSAAHGWAAATATTISAAVARRPQ